MPTKVPPWVWAKKKKQSAGSSNKPKERKTRFSRWFITCNANKKTSQISEAELKKRYQMCAMLLQQSRIKPYIYILNKEDTFEDHILEVTTEHAIEKNTRHFWHVHMIVALKHQSSIRLNYGKLRADFKKVMQVPSLHFDAKLFKGAADGIASAKQYLAKDKQSTDSTDQTSATSS